MLLWVCFVHQTELLRAGWYGNTAWDTSTFVGWQQISLIIESNTWNDCKRLHAAKKECVGSQRIFWLLEEEFRCLTRADLSTLCGVDRLSMLRTDTVCSQHRCQFWGLQTGISCFTNADSTILCSGLKLCVSCTDTLCRQHRTSLHKPGCQKLMLGKPWESWK